MTDETSTAGLVTDTTTPFTQPNPDPAHALDPAKAGQPVSSPHANHGAKPKKAKKPTKAKRAAAAAAAAKSKDVKAEASTAAAIASQEHARAHADELRAAYGAAKVHEVDSFDELPEDGELELRLANGSEFVDGAIAVDRADIVPAGFGFTWNRDLDIGPDCAPITITEVWLIAASGEALKCDVGTLAAGDGKHARIPAWHLQF